MKESTQDCLWTEDLACDQITPACYGRVGDDTTVCSEGKKQVVAMFHGYIHVPSYLLARP